MNQSILVIRIIVMLFCAAGGFVVSYVFQGAYGTTVINVLVGVLLGALLILIDILLKGFSLRALSGLTFGLLMGVLASHLISVSPLFYGGDPQVIYISRLCVFVGVTYLATVIALRGRDEFNLVIPYVKFEPRNVDSQIVVLDLSALVDGRIVKLVQTRVLSGTVTAPKFIIDELHELSNSGIEEERNRGRRGLQTLSELRKIDHLDFQIYDSEVKRDENRDDKLFFVVSSLKGRLLSTSESLIEKAKHSGITFVDILGLSAALTHQVEVGESVSVKIVKLGKEDGQGVGYLSDGSMVVVNHSADLIGATVLAEIESIIPTSGGRMVFGRLLGEDR